MNFELTPDYKQVQDGSRPNDSQRPASLSEAFAAFSADLTYQTGSAEASLLGGDTAFAPKAQIEQGKDGNGFIQLVSQSDRLYGNGFEAPKQSDLAKLETDRAEKNYEATLGGLNIKDAIAKLPEKPAGGWSFSGGTFEDFLNSKLG